MCRYTFSILRSTPIPFYRGNKRVSFQTTNSYITPSDKVYLDWKVGVTQDCWRPGAEKLVCAVPLSINFPLHSSPPLYPFGCCLLKYTLARLARYCPRVGLAYPDKRGSYLHKYVSAFHHSVTITNRKLRLIY